MFNREHIVLVTLFVVQLAKSEDCKLPTPDFVANAYECCDTDPSDLDDAVNACEGKGTICEITDCAFEKMKFMKDSKLDYTTMAAYLDGEAAKAPEFKEAVEMIKEICFKDLSDVAPGISCESIRVAACADHIQLKECPDKMWKKSVGCDAARDFMKRCPTTFA